MVNPIKFSVKVPWRDVDKIAKDLSGFRKVYGERVWTLTTEILEMLKRRTPRSKKSEEGYVHLQDAWKAEKGVKNNIIDRIIFHNVAKHNRVLLYLEYGTAPHVIKGNPVLCFEIDGKKIFATRVHHPGTKPYKIVGGILLDVGDMLTTVQREVVEELKAKMRGVI